MIITAFKNDEIVKRYKIVKSIFEAGFRILIDIPIYGKKNAVVIETDGKTERLFKTMELASEYVFNQIDKYQRINAVDKYTVVYM